MTKKRANQVARKLNKIGAYATTAHAGDDHTVLASSGGTFVEIKSESDLLYFLNEAAFI